MKVRLLVSSPTTLNTRNTLNFFELRWSEIRISKVPNKIKITFALRVVVLKLCGIYMFSVTDLRDCTSISK
jgi:hypothetical protein